MLYIANDIIRKYNKQEMGIGINHVKINDNYVTINSNSYTKP